MALAQKLVTVQVNGGTIYLEQILPEIDRIVVMV